MERNTLRVKNSTKSELDSKSFDLISFISLKKLNGKSFVEGLMSLASKVSNFYKKNETVSEELVNGAIESLSGKRTIKGYEMNIKDVPPIPVSAYWENGKYYIYPESYIDIQNYYKEFGYPGEEKKKEEPISEFEIENKYEVIFEDEEKKEEEKPQPKFLSHNELTALLNNYLLNNPDTNIQVDEKGITR